MKKSYKQPKVQVIEFECEDVIATSPATELPIQPHPGS